LAPQLRRKAAAAATKPKAPVKKLASTSSSTANQQLQKLKQAQNNLKQRQTEEPIAQPIVQQKLHANIERPSSPEIQADPADSAQASQSIFGEAIDVYDPSKPNDYLKLIEERQTQLKSRSNSLLFLWLFLTSFACRSQSRRRDESCRRVQTA